MAQIIQVRELAGADGVGSGRYRLTVKSDEDSHPAEPLCACFGGHDSPGAASECPDARQESDRILYGEVI